MLLRQLDGLGSVGYGAVEEEWRGEVIRLSWKPRAFLLKGFLTPDECRHLIDLVHVTLLHHTNKTVPQAKPTMGESLVVDQDTHENVPSEFRTSTGTFLEQSQAASQAFLHSMSLDLLC